MADCRDQDLRGQDWRGRILWGVDVRGANLWGLGVSINCGTFDHVILDDRQVALLLRLIALAEIDPRWVDGLQTLVRTVAGRKQDASISRYLDLHITE